MIRFGGEKKSAAVTGSSAEPLSKAASKTVSWPSIMLVAAVASITSARALILLGERALNITEPVSDTPGVDFPKRNPTPCAVAGDCARRYLQVGGELAGRNRFFDPVRYRR